MNTLYLVVVQPPIDMAVDPASGNVVLTMGQQGVLVGTRANQWRWATVRDFGYQDVAADTSAVGAAGIALLLSLPLLVAFISGAVAQDQRGNLVGLLGGVGGLLGAWSLGATTFRTQLGGPMTFPGELVAWALLAACCAFPSVFLLPRAFRLAARPAAGGVRRLLGWLALAALLYLLPFGLWAITAMARYEQATALAVFATAVVTFAGNRATARGRRQAAYDGAAAGSAPTA